MNRSPPRGGLRGGGGGGRGDRRDDNETRSLHCRGYNVEKTTADDLRGIFAPFGAVIDVYLPKEYFTNKPRGFAYIQFANEPDADRAREKLDRSDIFGDGKVCAIMWASGRRKTPVDMRRLDLERDNPHARAPPPGFRRPRSPDRGFGYGGPPRGHGRSPPPPRRGYSPRGGGGGGGGYERSPPRGRRGYSRSPPRVRRRYEEDDRSPPRRGGGVSPPPRRGLSPPPARRGLSPPRGRPLTPPPGPYGEREGPEFGRRDLRERDRDYDRDYDRDRSRNRDRGRDRGDPRDFDRGDPRDRGVDPRDRGVDPRDRDRGHPRDWDSGDPRDRRDGFRDRERYGDRSPPRRDRSPPPRPPADPADTPPHGVGGGGGDAAPLMGFRSAPAPKLRSLAPTSPTATTP